MSRHSCFLGLSLAILLAPGFCGAQIVFSEIMYDVSSDIGADDSREWVELYNAGESDVDLSDWKINDGSNHLLQAPPQNGGRGSLVIAPGGYAILADDASVFISLFPSYGGTVIDTSLALANSGDSLLLLDGSGAVVASASYTSDLGAAGDGNSLQRASVGAAFASLSPSPGAGLSPDTAQEGAEESVSASGSAGSRDGALQPHVPLRASAGKDRSEIAGADVMLVGEAYDEEGDAAPSAAYRWNFGDGTTADGKEVSHAWRYPGTYVVVLEVSNYEHHSSDSFLLKAELPQFVISAKPDGSIVIENRSSRDANLSGWHLQDRTLEYTFPEHTTVLKGASVRLAPETLGFHASDRTELLFPSGDPCPPIPLSSAPGAQPSASAPVAALRRESAPIVSAPAREESGSAMAETPVDLAAAALPTASSVPEPKASSRWLWWAACVALTAIAAFVVYLAARLSKREWRIIEEIPEQG